ncbi:hypothetical protein A4H97_23970 [Niastella yeongjuensis]|uniref:Uncharacterized protein n=1 Tax=Niastella yeongjuensis TaxID=354355 RepID=A0A1V9F3E2_9BACT|nr:hypothetical protein [Niastella yeongjuensis]OQP52766.1 hypothetical protein A4H97_23970 [Niastella yeongjuensis]SEP19191.1 hypothetical protein SAMN05660816_04681 [Niastella yeongjuensis]
MLQYATYTRFYSPDDAQFLISLLQKYHIPYALEHEVNQLDKVYLGEAVEAMFALQIPNEKFNHVNHLLAEQAIKDMAEPGFEHLMQTYSVSELQEIIHHPTGWNAYDLQVATSILSEKLQAEVTLPSIHADNFKPVRLELIWILLGYIISLLGASYFFYLAIAGFLCGLVVNQAKKTLKNGKTVKMYDQWSRMHGRFIMILAAVCLAINLILLMNLFKVFTH